MGAPVAGPARPPWLSGRAGAWAVRLAVQPGASRTEPAGDFDGCLKLRVAAPPVDGRANEAVTRWLAGALGIPRSAVTLAAGASGRRKVFELACDLPAEEIARSLYQGERP